MNVHDARITNDLGSQARFVAAAKKNKPMAWKQVELLRVACALPPRLSLEQSAATFSRMISEGTDRFGFEGLQIRANRSMWVEG